MKRYIIGLDEGTTSARTLIYDTKEKEQVTGFLAEPWHIRYVTKSLALYLSLTGMTLEEYHAI